MKKVIMMMIMCAATLSLHAQKFALLDMDYIPDRGSDHV